jgi:hypothetical protein
MTATEIVAAGILPNNRTYCVMSDGSRWEYVPERRTWERDHAGLPDVAYRPSVAQKPDTALSRTFCPPMVARP